MRRSNENFENMPRNINNHQENNNNNVSPLNNLNFFRKNDGNEMPKNPLLNFINFREVNNDKILPDSISSYSSIKKEEDKEEDSFSEEIAEAMKNNKKKAKKKSSNDFRLRNLNIKFKSIKGKAFKENMDYLKGLNNPYDYYFFYRDEDENTHIQIHYKSAKKICLKKLKKAKECKPIQEKEVLKLLKDDKLDEFKMDNGLPFIKLSPGKTSNFTLIFNIELLKYCNRRKFDIFFNEQ